MKTLLLSLMLLALPAYGQIIVSFSGGDPLTTAAGTAGFDFVVGTTPLVIQTLGVWDESGTGLTASHEVGLWDTTTKTLLASVDVVPSTATLVNGFWYENLSAPLTLQASHSYTIAAQYADVDFDLVRGNVPTVVTSGITLGSPVLSSGIGFSFPDVPLAQAANGFYGPNAGFVAVPEPAGWGVALAGLALAFVIFRSRH